jgi:hypothetical protein
VGDLAFLGQVNRLANARRQWLDLWPAIARENYNCDLPFSEALLVRIVLIARQHQIESGLLRGIQEFAVCQPLPAEVAR